MKRKVIGKVISISLVCLMVGTVFGRFSPLVKAEDLDEWNQTGWGESHNVAVVNDYYGDAVGYLYPSDYPNQTFSTLSASQISVETLKEYDTVIFFMFNPSELTTAQKTAINSWVFNGGKLIIWDSDQVEPGSPWDYSWLPYPFTTSTPGQTGYSGQGLYILENNQLSSSDSSSPYYIDTSALNDDTDAVGDANVLTSYSSGWHIDMTAKNVLGETGPAHVYAAYGSGLIIYSALDWDYAGYGSSSGVWLKKLLKQELECSYLPFGAPTVPEERGLDVEVTTDNSSYKIGENITFEVTVTNQTDKTGINITAYNVWFTVVSPDEIETPEVHYSLGDIPPGSSKNKTFEATAKKAGDDVEVIVNAYGEDRLLNTAIAGSRKHVLSIRDPEAPKPDWSFAVITDLHIGYDSTNREDLIDNALQTIIDEKDSYNIKFVAVLGDISDKAKENQFKKARDYLKKLNDPNGDENTDDGIPYIPLFGNHDTPDRGKNPLNWQWTGDEGGRLFQEIFWGESNSKNINLISETMKEWSQEVCTAPPYLQNYAFSYWEEANQLDRIDFVCLDLTGRLNSSLLAAYPEQTRTFLQYSLKNHQNGKVILLAHYPLRGCGGVLRTITDDIAQILADSNVLGKTYNFAGHTHVNRIDTVYADVNVGGLIIRNTKAYEVIETEPVSQIPLKNPFCPSSPLEGRSIRIVSSFNDGTLDYSRLLKPSKQIDILYPSPVITHTWGSYNEPNKDIIFTAHFTTYHGFKTSFDWDFGDGSYGSGSSVTHKYTQDSEYNVTLTVTTKNLITGNETNQSVTEPVYVISKHAISSLPLNLSATSAITEEDLTQVPKNTYQPTLIAKNVSEKIPIAELEVHFEEAINNINLSNLVADTDNTEKKSILYMPSWPKEIEGSKNLFIPSTGKGAVYICENAKSLEEVNIENADVIINVGETKDNMTVETTFYEGREYYVVSGVTGTGGGEARVPPTSPTLISPLDGTKTNDNTITFKWACGLDADNHRFLIDNDSDFSSPKENILLGATDNQYTTELMDENYSWKVIAINSVGENGSATWTLLIETAPPTISGVAATNITQNAATITWTTDELSNSAVEYGTTTAYGLTGSDAALVTSHSIDLTNLSAGTLYHYRVSSTDAAGNTSTSSDYTFTTSSPPPPPPPPPEDNTPPPIPSLVLPANGENITDNTPLLDWSDASDPSGVTYDMSIAGDAGFASIVIQKTGLAASTYELTPAEALTTDAYYWRARAVDGVGNIGSWSENWSFTVSIAPPTPPAAFTVSSLTISPSQVSVGEEVSISVTVKNTGDLEGTYMVTLKINGVVEDVKSVTVSDGSERLVTFTITKDVKGTYNVQVDGLTGSFTVSEAPPTPQPPPSTRIPLGIGIIVVIIVIGIGVAVYIKRR